MWSSLHGYHGHRYTSEAQTTPLKYLSLFPFHMLYLHRICLMDGKSDGHRRGLAKAKVEEDSLVRENSVFQSGVYRPGNTLFSKRWCNFGHDIPNLREMEWIWLLYFFFPEQVIKGTSEITDRPPWDKQDVVPFLFFLRYPGPAFGKTLLLTSYWTFSVAFG